MKRYLALFSVVALAAGALFFSSCATQPVFQEIPGVSFSHGQLITRLGASARDIVKGTREAAYQLQLASVKETATPVDASLVAYDPHGTRVVIRLTPVSDQVTEVRIKAGVIGDEGYSRRILVEIQKNLP